MASDDQARFGPVNRARALERCASETFDVLVVGGGVTGCGVALDAASRGLSVALVEKRDFAAGTSSRSSKLIHGGLRYLESFDIELVREALHERRLLVEKIAPHLVHPTPFLFPLKHRVWDRFYMGSGLFLYDALAGLHPAMPRHRHLTRALVPAGGAGASRRRLDRRHPLLRRPGRRRPILARAGANRCELTVRSASRRSGSSASCTRATGSPASARKTSSRGGELDVRARTVINATGVWTTEIERLAGVADPMVVRPSKGVHLVVPRERIDSEYALILRTEKSVLFILPWGDRWIIGTTDTDWHYGLDHPSATHADIEYLLDHVNGALREPLGFEDVIAVFVGLRPLLGGTAEETAKLSRNHAVRRSAPGFVSVAGGKYTTYRLMARDAVDLAARDLRFPVDSSRTSDVPLLGAVGLSGAELRLSQPPWRRPSDARSAGPSRSALRHAGVRGARPALPATPAWPPRSWEPKGTWLPRSVYAAAYEGALHVDDVLTRRTHIAFEVPDRGRLAADGVARLMAPVLGWDEAAVDREVAHYRARLEAESAAQALLTDAASDSARAAVRDPRLDHFQARGD